MIILDMDLFLYLVKQTESIKYDDIRDRIQDINNLMEKIRSNCKHKTNEFEK